MRSNNHTPPRPSGGKAKHVQMHIGWKEFTPEELHHLHAIGVGHRFSEGMMFKVSADAAHELVDKMRAAIYVPKQVYKRWRKESDEWLKAAAKSDKPRKRVAKKKVSS